MNKQSVLLGMSGGVDSSVAAIILQQQGFSVIGAFMKNWEEDDDPKNNYCNSTSDLNDAQQVCDLLKIPLKKVNFSAEYWDKVFNVFLNEYRLGRTPNPDILCNKEIKFKLFLDYAKQVNADFIATGHYARFNENTNDLLTGVDQNKDQSYFLHALTKKQLRSCLFPIGKLLKTEVRKIAKDYNLINHNKKDSTGICFIGERKFKSFLEKYLPNQPGLIVTDDSETIGQHDGLMYYTIGQRKGLKIGGKKIYRDYHEPWYVINKDLAKNLLIVARGKNNPKLFANQLLANNLNWINKNNIDGLNTIICQAKIRYRQKSQPCTIKILHNDQILVIFNDYQRAITPGQYIVFYQEEKCLGGAIIEQTI